MKAIDVDELWKRIHDTDMEMPFPAKCRNLPANFDAANLNIKPDSWLKESLSPKLTG